MVRKDKTLIIITKQFNITTEEYPIKILNGEFEPWEKILKILNIKVWQNNPNNIFIKNINFESPKLPKIK